MTTKLRIEGPVVIGQSLTDPGDMGEPRVFESDGVTYVTVPDVSLWPAERATQAEDAGEWRRLVEDGIEAFRLTREYVGEDTLPAIEGWSWFDWTQRAAAALAATPEPVTQVEAAERFTGQMDWPCVCGEPKGGHYFGDRLGEDRKMHTWCQLNSIGACDCQDFRPAAARLPAARLRAAYRAALAATPKEPAERATGPTSPAFRIER